MAQLNSKDVEKLYTANRPIPGQSLTNNPEEPLPFERPTKFVELQPALEQIFLNLTSPQASRDLKAALSNGIPVATLTETILMVGFSEGEWNPDLMMLLLEPVFYMIISIADRLGVENLVILPGERPNVEEVDEEELKVKIKEAKRTLVNKFQNKSPEEPSQVMEEVPMDMQEEQEPRSLLSRG